MERVPLIRDDEYYMRQCLALAEAAMAKGEVPVGAMVVLQGRVLGEGMEATCESHDPTAHAEVLAVRAACAAGRTRILQGATLYTTVEPCVFCGFAVRSAHVSRVVYGAPAGQLGACHPPYFLMTDESIASWGPPPSIVQVLSEECAALLDRYAARKRSLPLTG